MKLLYLTCAILFVPQAIHAQTNLINTTGNIGIGTLSPSFSTNLGVGLVSFANGDYFPIFRMERAGASTKTNTNWEFTIGSTGSFHVMNQNASMEPLVIENGTPSYILYGKSNGNVGIGTNSPEAKLEIGKSGGSAELRIITYDSSGGYNNPKLSLYSNYPGDRNWQLTSSVYRLGDFGIYQSSNSRGNPFGDNARLFINPDGLIGIGTTSPSEKLSVNGNVYANGNISASGFIRTKKITVTQRDWSDYVFDDTYKLLPITALSEFIKQNKHLPDIPTAKEVQEKGLDIGDNQALLLKKIEELTLYVIDLKNEIEQLKKKVNK